MLLWLLIMKNNNNNNTMLYNLVKKNMERKKDNVCLKRSLYLNCCNYE